ncbi:DNA-directed DNA polymerase eta rad30, partial [Cladochytrium tenue]
MSVCGSATAAAIRARVVAAAAAERTIIHLDLDAFYAQVEMVRLGVPPDKPLAVLQWRRLIAVNYPSRAFGIKRHMTADEALRLCPDLILVHVATIATGDAEPKYHERPSQDTHKISLDAYRVASLRIMRVLARAFPLYQRASIDEVYIDASAAVAARILAAVDSAASPNAPCNTELAGSYPTTSSACADSTTAASAAALDLALPPLEMPRLDERGEPEVCWDGAGFV